MENIKDKYLDSLFYMSKELDTKKIMGAQIILKDMDYESEENNNIGQASIYVISPKLYYSWDDLIMEADEISGDLAEVTAIMGESKAKIMNLKSLNLVILDNVEIKKEYRNKGYLSRLIEEVEDYLPILGASYIGLIPARFIGKEVIRNDENVIKYFKEKGYKKILRRGTKDCIMLKTL